MIEIGEIEEVIGRLDNLNNLSYVLMIMHENMDKLKLEAINPCHKDYIKLFSFIGDITTEERHKLEKIVSRYFDARANTNSSKICN